MTILSAVTDVEAEVVDTVKSLKKPLVDYIGTGVEYAEGWVPRLRYPTQLPELPKPVDLLDSQYEFVTALLAAQHDLVKTVVQRGIEFTEDWVPRVSPPTALPELPEPVELLDSQYKFVTALLGAEHDVVKAMLQTLAPLTGAYAKPKASVAKATKAAA